MLNCTKVTKIQQIHSVALLVQLQLNNVNSVLFGNIKENNKSSFCVNYIPSFYNMIPLVIRSGKHAQEGFISEMILEEISSQTRIKVIDRVTILMQLVILLTMWFHQILLIERLQMKNYLLVIVTLNHLHIVLCLFRFGMFYIQK